MRVDIDLIINVLIFSVNLFDIDDFWISKRSFHLELWSSCFCLQYSFSNQPVIIDCSNFLLDQCWSCFLILYLEMSADLQWLLVKDNTSFLVKRNGVTFTREPGNLKNLNRYRFSGLANKKTVDIRSNTKSKTGVTVTLKSTRGSTLRKVNTLLERVWEIITINYDNITIFGISRWYYYLYILISNYSVISFSHQHR